MKTVLFACTFGLLIAVSSHADEPYHFIKEIPVGGEGGWDYLTADPAAHRLYVSHATKVVVIDTESGQIVGEITNTIGVHGIALAPKFNRGFVSDGRANQVSIFDLKTLQTVATVPAGRNPDCIMAGPKQQEIYAFNGKDHSATVIATDTGSVVATIPLDGKPEFAQLDGKAGRMFDNIEDKSEVAVIDTSSHQVVTNWPEAPGESASGMAIDRKAHHLFLGCDNQMMVMMDDQTGKVLATVPIGDGVDANAFDPETKLAFASCGDGTTTIAHEDGDTLTVVQTLRTERGARTMALDSKTHDIYLATARMEAPAPGERRGKVVPGTFKILVYGMK
jgi:DNA-binding beta-propeller fold protein YncE